MLGGNAIDEVKEIADVIIRTNDADGIAEYLEKDILYRKTEFSGLFLNILAQKP